VGGVRTTALQSVGEWNSASLTGDTDLTFRLVIDALFVLGCYWTAPTLVLGWIAPVALFLIPQADLAPEFAVALKLVGYQVFGSQTTFTKLRQRRCSTEMHARCI